MSEGRKPNPPIDEEAFVQKATPALLDVAAALGYAVTNEASAERGQQILHAQGQERGDA